MSRSRLPGCLGRLVSLRSLARKVDQLPLFPARVADAAIMRLHRRRRDRAASHPTWAEIEGRRKWSDSGRLVLVSDDVTMRDLDTQERIEHDLLPDPWWVPVARKVQQLSVASGVSKVVWASQRVRRGWDDTAVWDIGQHLTSTLADQLEELAKIKHGWPLSDEYPTPEDWDAALLQAARDLRRYGGTPEHEAASERWFELMVSGADPDDEAAARNEMYRIEAEDHAAAKAAMHWVADNLHSLWD